MTLYFLNGFTCKVRISTGSGIGALCLLVASDAGLILVDTGLGLADYANPPLALRAFGVLTKMPLAPEEALVRQIARLGYAPDAVRHIVLTHMHFDHCGGLPDFPRATVHVHRREMAAFTGRPRRPLDLGYVRRHIAHAPDVALYAEADARWFDFPAIRLPLEPAMWLIPLFGHTAGHCGVAIQTETGWLFQVGSAAPGDMIAGVPARLVRWVLGPQLIRLRAFAAEHPDVQMVMGHMPLDFFTAR